MRVPGTRNDHQNLLLSKLGSSAQLAAGFDVSAGARDESAAARFDARDNDLVEVELENGVVLWTSLALLRSDSPTTARDGGEEWLPAVYGSGAGSRGAVGIAIRALRFFKLDPVRQSVKALASRIEGRLHEGGGVFRVDLDGRLHAAPLPTGSEATLVFIHGTASHTRGGFGGLLSARLAGRPNEESEAPEEREIARAKEWRALHQHYGGRVFAFEHATLTKSPVENAIEFLERLPAAGSAKLHLVTHSRGGLVGDLLAHGQLPDPFPERLLDAAGVEASSRDAWRRLRELLRSRRPVVERFVRVGCPAKGTSLASDRLDRYLSILVHLLRMVPAAGGLLGGLAELAAAAAKERANPAVLPGLEAQRPVSSFIRALNASQLEAGADLVVIAGDSEGLLKNLANLFYWGENDLVVDTRSMHGGARRSTRRWFEARASDVHHCNYFERPESVKKLAAALRREAGWEDQFTRMEHKSGGTSGARGAECDATVVLIPGFMGSRLALRGVEFELQQLMSGGLAQLELKAKGAAKLEARSLEDTAYGVVTSRLRAQGFDVVGAPYDWRLSAFDAARQLAGVVKAQLSASKRPVHLLAHSLGSLVAAAFMAEHAPLWDKLRASGGRLVLAGSMRQGCAHLPALLAHAAELTGWLSVLDPQFGRERVEALLASFPSLLETLPRGDGVFDLFQKANWDALGVTHAPGARDLSEAGERAQQLDRALDDRANTRDGRLIVLAGSAANTPVLGRASSGARLDRSSDGDGRVLHATCTPRGAPTYFVDAEHGDLLDAPETAEALAELFRRGVTQRLESQPRPARDDSSARVGAPPKVVEVFPGEDLLLSAALGRSQRLTHAVARTSTRCDVRVLHGDLAYVAAPVLVGHYSGDPLLHAEAALDHVCHGELTRRHALGLYPAEIGAAEVVLPPPESHDHHGAIVVGLGRAGELTAGGLSRTTQIGMLRLVEARRARGSSESEHHLACLLVGSGEAGLSLDQCLEATLRAVRRANELLTSAATASGSNSARIARLDFIELYEDRALEALSRLKLLARGGFSADVKVEAKLIRTDGGRRRAWVESASGWWVRLAIKAKASARDEFEFTAHGGRAGAAVESLRLQPTLVDEFLRESLANTRAHRPELPRVLFELLLPSGFKRAASERNNVVLVLDERSAQLPWEMLVDRLSTDEQPIAVAAGMLRELLVPSPRMLTQAVGRSALVVGDPPSDLPTLEGARHEARAVANQLESSGWRVVRQISDGHRAPIQAASVVELFLNDDYRILHLAGHGLHADDPGKSGMVIGVDAAGQRVFISPREIEQMRYAPELVFINCCHLGRVEASTRPYQLAANLAHALIAKGVRAVVAAGWAVDDEAANTFAMAFYERMLAGATFGDAVRDARETTYRLSRTNTWSAYQCYGAPGFRLELHAAASSYSRRKAWSPSYGDPSELVVEIENLRSRCKADSARGSMAGVQRLRAQADDLRGVANREGWSQRSDCAGALGLLYGELGDFEEALNLLTVAIEGSEGLTQVVHAEKRENFRIRLAAERIDEAKKRGDKPAVKSCMNSINRGIEALQSLIMSAGKTSERHSLLASGYKRRICASLPAETRKAANAARQDLRKMIESYQQAADLQTDEPAYSQLNVAFGLALTPTRTQAEARRLEEALDKLRRLASGDNEGRFWKLILPAELELLTALVETNALPDADALVEHYLTTSRGAGSLRQWRTVREQLDFIRRVLRGLEPQRGSHGERGRRKHGPAKEDARLAWIDQVIAGLERRAHGRAR
jgi:tetratricopeptide (TPR) repeat protein